MILKHIESKSVDDTTLKSLSEEAWKSKTDCDKVAQASFSLFVTLCKDTHTNAKAIADEFLPVVKAAENWNFEDVEGLFGADQDKKVEEKAKKLEDHIISLNGLICTSERIATLLDADWVPEAQKDLKEVISKETKGHIESYALALFTTVIVDILRKPEQYPNMAEALKEGVQLGKKMSLQKTHLGKTVQAKIDAVTGLAATKRKSELELEEPRKKQRVTEKRQDKNAEKKEAQSKEKKAKKDAKQEREDKKKDEKGKSSGSRSLAEEKSKRGKKTGEPLGGLRPSARASAFQVRVSKPKCDLKFVVRFVCELRSFMY